MESRSCMNSKCRASTSIERRKGWPLQSGGYAVLCDKCGSAFEKLMFCEEFHSKHSGWRKCISCGKHLHCGCSASMSLIVLLDKGGVCCINCAKNPGLDSMAGDDPNGFGTLKTDNACDLQSTSMDNKVGGSGHKFKLTQLGNSTEGVGLRHLLQFPDVSFGNMKPEEAAKSDISKAHIGAKDIYESFAQTNLSITLCSPVVNSNSFPSAVVDEKEHSKTSSIIHQGPKSRHLLPKPPKIALATVSEANVGRITDQELQKISGDSNSTIVPMFEKVLSASDAGRIGHLVLPKACAEAYFPLISQPEGLVFQFRFWPNNNSMMYVLEGVTPCIQSMELQAGDIVTLSRMDPEGKLFMGFRKAPNAVAVQTLKGSADPHLSAPSKHLNSTPSDISWLKSEKHEDKTRDGLLLPSMLVPERKRSRNIGSKSKRLLIDRLDALELKLTWEEAEHMLCPPPSVIPSIVMVENPFFEEYEDRPVFGKMSIFVVRTIGGLEQWAQCDGCSKWRRLPVDVLLPSKWMRMDNVGDQCRCSCSVPDELIPREVENLITLNKDFKKRKIATSHRPNQEHELSGLEALSNAATLGENVGDPGTASVATTAKHPRHCPCCSCIVCI